LGSQSDEGIFAAGARTDCIPLAQARTGEEEHEGNQQQQETL